MKPRQVTINNLGIGRSVDETIRLIHAHQFLAEHGEVCPAGWKPGDKSMKPGLDDSMEYFASGATESEEDPLQVHSCGMVPRFVYLHSCP